MALLTFKGLRAFAAFLDAGAARCTESQAIAARLTAERMAVVARGLYGADPPLATLKDSTQEERASLGIAPNEPLYRGMGARDGSFGVLRDGVRPYATPTLAVIENMSPIAAYHEFGYTTQPFGNAFAAPVAVPPRPVFRYTMIAMRPFIIEQGGEIAQKTLGVRGVEL